MLVSVRHQRTGLNIRIKENVGIFSLFGKKENQQAKPADKESSRSKRQESKPRSEGNRTSTRASSAKRDAQAALATALKIDAIESEMSSEFVHTTTKQPLPSRPKAPQATPDTPPSGNSTPKAPAKAEPGTSILELQPLSPELGTTTEFLLDGQTAVSDIAEPASEAAAVIEEVAILYANGQFDVVEQMLQGAIADDKLGSVTQQAWLMLFDLYQIVGKQQEFENLSIEYASKFETSPPAWTSSKRQESGGNTTAGTTPMVNFSGKLDAASAKHIERIQKLAENYRTLRLEFARVTDVEAVGCSLLLGVLKKLQKSGHDLILVGAPELANKIRGMLEVGRRDDTEDAWLLLLEILQLLNLEKEFEEISIDYCITFEVSPPAFVAPKNKVTTATMESSTTPTEVEGFSMPAVVEGRVDELIVGIANYSDEHNPAVIDCSQLLRVDFNAAGRLLSGLAPFCGNGKSLEFHNVNHFVAELFNIIGLKDIARILPRKN